MDALITKKKKQVFLTNHLFSLHVIGLGYKYSVGNLYFQ